MFESFDSGFTEVSTGDIVAFKKCWAKFDSDKKGFIPVKQLKRFLNLVSFPFGYECPKDQSYLKWVKSLEIRTHSRMKFVYFYNTLFELYKGHIFRSIVANTVGTGKKRTKQAFYEIMRTEIEELKELKGFVSADPYSNSDALKNKFPLDRFKFDLKRDFGPYLKVQHAWGYWKLAKFFRCYVDS